MPDTRNELLDIEEALISGLMCDQIFSATRSDYDLEGNHWRTPELRSLQPWHFWGEKSKWIFETIKSLVDAGKPCDWLSVSLEMAREQPRKYAALIPGKLSGQECFYSLLHKYKDYALTYRHLKWYARLIREAAEERQPERPKKTIKAVQI